MADIAQAIMQERARVADFAAERIAAVKAQVQHGKLSEDVAALTIIHIEMLVEMIGLGLHDIERNETDGE